VVFANFVKFKCALKKKIRKKYLEARQGKLRQGTKENAKRT
jgi:hypothetical protein